MGKHEKPDNMSDRSWAILMTLKDGTKKLAKDALSATESKGWMESEPPTDEEMEEGTGVALANVWGCSVDEADEVMTALAIMYGPAAPPLIAGIAMGIEFVRAEKTYYDSDYKEAS